jgi:RNA polymerase sigma-32 factor
MPLDAPHTSQLPRIAMQAEMLDAKTEHRLATAWRERGDEAALHRLITAYMRLAISMASKFRRYGAPMNDLIQEAGLGLMKAAEKFDPERGVRFSTYAMWWIRAGIQDYVMRNWSLVRTGSTSTQKALFFNMRRVQARLEREAMTQGVELQGYQLRAKIAREIGVPLCDVELMVGRLAGTDLSLNASQSNDEEGREWIEALKDDGLRGDQMVERDHDLKALRGWLAAAMAVLSTRERHIVEERRLREVPRTLQSLGAELGLSKERIRQVEAAALGKMRQHLEREGSEVIGLLV